MNNIIILLLIVLILSYFVFLYDLNNFIEYKNIDKFNVQENICYARNMDNLDVNMRKCSIYYTNKTSLCDQYSELYVLSKNYLLNKINNPNNDPNSIIINDKKYTLDILKEVYNDKSRNNITSTCKYNPEGLYEIDNNLNDTNKYQKKIILNSFRPNNNYMYSCFLPLTDSNITSNGLINQKIIDSYNTENSETPCIDDKTPVTNIICHGFDCPSSNNFLPINLNVVQRVNNSITDIDDTLIFIKFRQTNYGIKSISFESFVQYNKTSKVFENIAKDNPYIKSLINEKLCNIIYKNGNIYLSPKILEANVFTFTFNDNDNILLYDILNNPLKDFSLKYLSINDIKLNNYDTTMKFFYDPVVRLSAYIRSKTDEPILNIDRINNYITEYNNIEYNTRIKKIDELNNNNKYIVEYLRPNNELIKNNKLEDCPINKNRGGCDNVFQKCKRSGNNYQYCFSNKYLTCLYCNRSQIEQEHRTIDDMYAKNYNDNINKINSINSTPLDISNNINRLETYPGIFDIINLSQFVFNNAYINNFDDSLLSVDDNCIYVNIPV